MTAAHKGRETGKPDPPAVSGQRKLIRFIGLTGLSFVINFGLTIGLHELAGVSEEIAYAIALGILFFVNFIVMRVYVFAGGEGHAGKQLLLHGFSAAGFRGLEYVAFLLIHSRMGMQYILAILLIQSCSFLAKFFFYGKVVFARPRV